MGQKIKQQQQTPKNSHMSSVYNKQQPPKVQKHHLSTILHSSPLPTPQTIMIPALNHSSASKSTVTTAYQPYESSSEIFISDTFHNNIISDDDDDVAQQQQQQQQQQERKGMVRRELGRRILEWKKKKKIISNSNNLFNLGKKANRAIIDGNVVDRVFGGATVSNKNNDTELPGIWAQNVRMKEKENKQQ